MTHNNCQDCRFTHAVCMCNRNPSWIVAILYVKLTSNGTEHIWHARKARPGATWTHNTFATRDEAEYVARELTLANISQE